MPDSMVRNATGIVGLALVLAACAEPAPRGPASPGVAVPPTSPSVNAPYYQGSDPSFPRPTSRPGA